MFRGRAEQPLEPSPQVGSLAYVGFGLWVVSAKEKNCRCGGNYSKRFSVACRNELDARGKHKAILLRIWSARDIKDYGI
jgi:hypothetical protein